MTELTHRHKQTLGETRLEVDFGTFFNEVVPSEVTEVIQALAAELSPLPPMHVPVRRDGHAIYGWPADGVAAKICTDGGTIRLGWRMREWPGILLTAEPHAVWVDPDGTLIDITPGPAAGDRSLFVPVTNYPEPFGADRPPPTRYRVLYQAPDYSAAAAERIARMKSGQRGYEDRRARKAGKTLEEWIYDKYYRDPLPGLIAAFIAACDGFDARLPTLPGLIETDAGATDAAPPYPLSTAQDAADAAVTAPDAGAMAAAAASPESAPMEPTSAIDAGAGAAEDTKAGPPTAVADDNADEDLGREDDDEPSGETWAAEDNLVRWSREREICRAAIRHAMTGE